LWRDVQLRVIDVGDADYPGYARVIWNTHAPEMSDLPIAERERVMRVVYAVEESLREILRPDKINLASLGNQVPHLHWHIIPRFIDDPHFPDSVWSTRKRPARQGGCDLALLRRAIERRLGIGAS
jgi:diadenosine tetraphosphate (Ap4A) HIT family hydrolase